ncbi:uncharacterized protein ACR2FA_007703 [Aphomia sociella]
MTTKQNSKNLFNCAYCEKQFKYDSERKRHEQSHSPQFECKVCSKRFSFLSALRRHEKQHERTGSVPCTKCNRQFRDEILLKRHIKYAHKGTCICSKCNTTFSSELALRTHMKTHKPEWERRYRCSVNGCGKSFNFPHHLKHHEFTHTNIKQHYCKVCGKGFIQSHHLKTHMKSHEPSTWLVCPMPSCTKKFTNETARKRHLRIHERDVDSGSSCDSNTNNTDGQKLLDEVHNNVGENQLEHLSREDLKNILNIPNVTGVIINVKASRKDLSNVNRLDNSAVANCKSALGGCIMSNDSQIDKNCLCAQISSPVDDYYDQTPNEEFYKTDEVHKEKVEAIKDVKSGNDEVSFCEGCDCGAYNTTNLEATSTCDVLNHNKDGTNASVKTNDNNGTETTKEKVEENKNVFVPFNSCKSILGKCIVSGNGTIGEGCLCAKMAMDDQSLIAEEIDEITPCPKIY